jgi:hypothetical protein
MMSDVGNKKIARAVAQAKERKDLERELEKSLKWLVVSIQKQKKTK